ncbi:MAG: hypothetical protein EOS65_02265 [Mesorhizobium sp.]|uniref:DUF6348 family protein n=1 Tax=Mesorhizobium sp. TaxID=1871066 RepID=UPI000FE5EF80|nr:DUF6348 family protein [Mesorhizobium sp.]RWF28789.1 MAG: hypothetical protein EOS45_20790 [Mesorhizobium sp.]RWF44220.1 MAG: hypothetical protein EOS65_02265 [Mesorhizobium sp.]TIX18168.1 MAG: hypothetical protein E5V41_07305 [Mesorhizobium sp.]TJW02926.1 MAG: hypothetical protein E5W97_20725 [Mesorhizobium sp.]
MASDKVLDMIHGALIAHGIDAVRRDQNVLLQSRQLRFEAEVFEAEAGRLVLEIYIFSPLLDVQPVIESFAGFGDTREQELNQAFEKFLRGVFHVAIEGLADHVCDNMQAEVEVWQQSSPSWKIWQKNVRWKIYGGQVISQATTELNSLNRGYPTFYAKLEKLFTASVSPGSHFVRTFFAALKGELICTEVLLDNKVWQEGQDLALSHDWDHGDGYQAVRQVILALPIGGT